MLKLKKNAQKTTVDFLLDCLNSEESKVQEGEFFSTLNTLVQAEGVTLSDKEAFILQSGTHVYQAAYALELYRLRENLGLYDATLAFSADILKVHVDYFTDYALTLGRSSQGISQFRNNMQAMVDSSKLLQNGGSVDRALCDALDLPSVYTNHGLMHERVILLC